MSETCGCGDDCKPVGMAVQYKCDCGCDDCPIIEFKEVPNNVPYCCGKPMKRVK